ncbi:MAG: cupin domain-containing protein [Pseudomonadota bacterium]
MPEHLRPIALVAADAAPRSTPSRYPEPFASRMRGRTKRALGEVFGLHNLGVNLTRLEPGAVSALRHAHSRQDEFIYVLEGRPALHTDEGLTRLSPGMCAGFAAGSGNAHCLVNDTATAVLYLEIGDRSSGDEVRYPDDDLRAELIDSQWAFSRKDGSRY